MRCPVLLVLAALAVGTLGGEVFSASQAGEQAFAANSGVEPRPVLLELFTSEGCSSCPPADAFLKQLDDAGRLQDVAVIAIEEHVDYWDRLGWRDPFSSHDWTERQEQYASSFRRDGVYTPQLVVNGVSELVGSSAREARQKIIEAARIPGVELRVAARSVAPESAEVSVNIPSMPAEARSATVWLAVTERGLSSNVLRGENEGRNLTHAAVLRSLTRVKLRHADPSAPTESKATVRLDRAWKREDLRFVVFLQEAKTLHILGAAACMISR